MPSGKCLLGSLRSRDEPAAFAVPSGARWRETLNIKRFSALFQAGLAGGQIGPGAVDRRYHQKRSQQAKPAERGDKQDAVRFFHARW